MPHGVANAVLLPHVLRFNLSCAPEPDAAAMARKGVERLSELGVPASAVDSMARAAMTVTRLLKNNLRPLTEADAACIYREALV